MTFYVVLPDFSRFEANEHEKRPDKRDRRKAGKLSFSKVLSLSRT